MRALLLALAVVLLPSAAALAPGTTSLPAAQVNAVLQDRPASLEVEVEAPAPAEGVLASAPDVRLPGAGLDLSDGNVAIREPKAQGPGSEAMASPAGFDAPAAARSAGLATALALGLAWAAGPMRGLPALAWLFSRIRDPQLLDNGTRRRIHDAVREDPGIATTAICERVGAAWGTTVRHLARLEARGLVASVRGGAGRQYFVANTGPSQMRDLWAAISHPTAARVARFVHDHPGTDQGGLCVSLGLRNPAASKHLTRFERLGLVQTRWDARHRRYAPTPELARLLAEAHRPSTV